MWFAAMNKLLQLAGLLMLLGYPVFWLAIAGPTAGVRPVPGRRILTVALAGAGLVFLAIGLDLYRILLPLLPGLSAGEKGDLVVSFMRHTEVGRWMALRVPAMALYLLALGLGGSRRSRAGGLVVAATALFVVLTVSMSGHAPVSMGPVLGAVTDGLHLLVTVVWTGALVGLALHLRPGEDEARRVLAAAERVSFIGLAGVLALSATGFVLASIHVAGPGIAAHSVYGRALGAKLALFAVLVAVAAGNRFHSLPALRRAAAGEAAAAGAIGEFHRRVRLEALLVAGIFAATALLTQVWPPSSPGRLAERQVWVQEVGPWSVEMALAPAQRGTARIDLRVEEADTGRPVSLDRVRVAMDMETHVMGVIAPRLQQTAPGTYTGTTYILMPGRWQVDVVLGAGGHTGTFTVFLDADEVPFTERAPFQIVLRAGVQGPLRVAFGLLVAATGLWIFAQWIPRLRSGGAWGGVVSGLLFFLGGFFWVLHLALNPTTYTSNPIPAAESVAAEARPLYEQHCAPCHGPEGRGDGPLAAGLRPPPADFVVHVGHHREGEFFWLITHGVQRTAMPAFQNVLSEEERWLLARYVRELGFAGRRVQRSQAEDGAAAGAGAGGAGS